MRRVGLLLALAILASSASPAAAHRFPEECTSNRAQLTLSSPRTNVRPGETIRYTVGVSNVGAGACDVTADVTLQLPAADGTPTGETVSLAANATLPAGTLPHEIGTHEFVVAVDPGVSTVTAQVRAVGVVHDFAVDSPATQSKTVGTVTTQPSLALAFTASPATSFAPLNVVYDYALTNTSTTVVRIAAPTINHTGCAPINRLGGDTNGNAVLDNGEAWGYRCSRLFALPQQFSSTAAATGVSLEDDRLVLAAQKIVVVDALRPPRPVLTLTRAVTPASGPAPLAVTHTYDVRNDSGADARPVKNVTIDDPLCPQVQRTGGDDLLQRGETWSYRCDMLLPIAQTVSGTALARGADDLEELPVTSNAAFAEVTATQVGPSPTPIPIPAQPTPVPDPPEPSAPQPATRVDLAVNGRVARPCAKTATAQVKVGRRLVASKRVKLDRRCRYRARFNVQRSRLRGATRVTVTVRSSRRTVTHRLSVPT